MTTAAAGQGGPEEPGTGARVPTCYRHAGRETYVRCNRCERPICPDCMRSASVGFQCPECVADGGRATRSHRTFAGGAVRTRQGRVTLALIGLCAAAFLAELATPDVEARFSLVGVWVADGQWYRLLTSMFLHVAIWHLAVNMLALFALGPFVEAALGRWRFLSLYLLSGLAGSALSYLMSSPAQPSEGASGALFGVLAAQYVIGRRLRVDTSQAAVWIVLNLVLGFVIPRINYWAHIGGLLVGAALAAAFAFAPARTRPASHVAAVGAAALLVVAVVVARTAALT